VARMAALEFSPAELATLPLSLGIILLASGCVRRLFTIGSSRTKVATVAGFWGLVCVLHGLQHAAIRVESKVLGLSVTLAAMLANAYVCRWARAKAETLPAGGCTPACAPFVLAPKSPPASFLKPNFEDLLIYSDDSSAAPARLIKEPASKALTRQPDQPPCDECIHVHFTPNPEESVVVQSRIMPSTSLGQLSTPLRTYVVLPSDEQGNPLEPTTEVADAGKEEIDMNLPSTLLYPKANYSGGRTRPAKVALWTLGVAFTGALFLASLAVGVLGIRNYVQKLS